MAMTRSREAAATRLLAKLEQAIEERTDARAAFSNLPAGVDGVTLQAFSARKRATEARFNMLRGTTWRALVHSTEEL